MAVNQVVVGALQARPVPLDLQCVLPQATADAIAESIQVVGLASQIASPNGVTPITNNTSQQALTLAQNLQTLVAQLQATQFQQRIVANRAAVPTGNAQVPYTISPGMPSDNYMVDVNFLAGDGHVTIPKWRIKNGSQTTNGFTLIYDDLPAGLLVNVDVRERKNIPAS